MTPPTFLEQFWPALLATFGGVFLALWLDRRREQARRRSEETDLLRVVFGSIDANSGILSSLERMLAEKGERIPALQVELGLLDAVLPRLVQVSTDTELVAEIAAFRWGLQQIDRGLDHLVHVALNPFGDLRDPVVKAAFEQRLAQMAGIVSKTVARVQQVAGVLLAKIEARIGPIVIPKRPEVTRL